MYINISYMTDTRLKQARVTTAADNPDNAILSVKYIEQKTAT